MNKESYKYIPYLQSLYCQIDLTRSFIKSLLILIPLFEDGLNKQNLLELLDSYIHTIDVQIDKLENLKSYYSKVNES